MRKWLLLILIISTTMIAGCTTKEYRTVSGLILSAGSESILIQVTEGFDGDMMQIHITDKTKFERGIPQLLEKGKTVTLTIEDEIMESHPVQARAVRILKHE